MNRIITALFIIGFFLIIVVVVVGGLRGMFFPDMKVTDTWNTIILLVSAIGVSSLFVGILILIGALVTGTGGIHLIRGDTQLSKIPAYLITAAGVLAFLFFVFGSIFLTPEMTWRLFQDSRTAAQEWFYPTPEEEKVVGLIEFPKGETTIVRRFDSEPRTLVKPECKDVTFYSDEIEVAANYRGTVELRPLQPTVVTFILTDKKSKACI